MKSSTALLLQRSFFAVGLLLGVVAILYGARVWLVPLALAVLLAFILTPVVQWLERQRLPRTPAVALAAVATLVLIVAAGYIVTLQLGGLAAQLQQQGQTYRANITAKLAPVLDLLQSAQGIEDAGKKLSDQVPAPKEPRPSAFVEAHGMAMLSWLPTVVWPVLDIGMEALLVVVLAIFILLDRETLRDRVLGLLGQRNLAGVTRAMNDTADRVSRFLLLLLCMNTAVGVAVAVGLYFIGMPYAVLWGVLAGALRFIPYVGIWVAAALPFGLSLALFPDWTPPLLVIGLFVVLELVMFNLVEPFLIGHGTGVAPLPLLVAAVFWSWLWGPAGLFLSTPLTVCLVVLGRHVPALRFLDMLLGARPPLDVLARYYQRLLAGDLDGAAILVQELLARPVDAVCDEVVLPALARARIERDDDELTADEEQAVLRGTRLLLRSALVPALTPATPRMPAPRVLGCPVQGAADALALQMLGLLVRMAGGELKIVSVRRLAEEAAALAREGRPVIVAIGTLPPGGIAQAAHLCRLVRARAPGAKIVVGRWARAEDAALADERLRSAGAEAIGATLHETLEHVLAALGEVHAEAKPLETGSHDAKAAVPRSA